MNDEDTGIRRPVGIRRSPALVKAFELAEEAHSDQRRKDGRPYIEHPTQVAQLLDDVGAEEEILVAAVLHDSVEDSELGVDEIRESFGGRVADLVEALTEDSTIESWVDRKEDMRRRVAALGPGAGAIYTADKIVNLREVLKLYAFHGERAGELEKAPTLDHRVEAWNADLAMAVEVGVLDGLCRYFSIELNGLERAREGEI
ncbi:MAG: diphosphokinase / guanosine-3,5-bis(diphosphate) 3-diphosphatase [Solirubrobacterales bacterium]|jgi:(p)ppGpp synthase/HD superfamily hydrolase|nr:diphosphokinase / guanosine-3,5-bis(diphosphate) 3-diphosphatase [Solirubrobacterales bacterium]